jgi:hypothetical protein
VYFFWNLLHHSASHVVNILIHVIFGSAALLLGIGTLATAKGGSAHRRLGTLFLYCLGVVITTAGIGLLVFDFRAFLAVVTLLSVYDAFSGIRALKLRGRRPEPIDIAVSALALLSPAIFLTLMRRLHLPWSPVLTYAILSGIFAMSLYDLSRNFLPAKWLRKVWMQEHLVKMISAYVAISSAFAGTVFPMYMPWSAIIPSTVGYVLIALFLIQGPRRWAPSVPFRTQELSRQPT